MPSSPQRESLFPQFDTPVIAPASREAWAHVRKNLNEREIGTMLLVFDYLERTRHADVTGGELAAFSGEAITTIRPNLHRCHKKGWLSTFGLRVSRVAGELRSHPYQPELPREAVERAARELKRKEPE